MNANPEAQKNKTSSSEVGHLKNMTNFQTLSLILQEMGMHYNPTNSDIHLHNLTLFQFDLNVAFQIFHEKKPLYTNAVVNREMAIAKLSKTTSKILNHFRSLRISTADKENLSAMVKKIRGDKKLLKSKSDSPETKTISTSQMSYDSRIANLDAIISFLKSHPEYNPNEEDITIEALESYLEELKTLTQIVNATANALLTARKNRNNLLYHNNRNVIGLAKEIKAYLKSLGHAGHPYYKAAVRLQFTNLRNS